MYEDKQYTRVLGFEDKRLYEKLLKSDAKVF